MTELEIFGKEEQKQTFVIRALNCYQDGYDSQNQSGCILYEGNNLQTIRKPTYHKLISKNLNSISLLLNDDIQDKPSNGIPSGIDLGVILHIKDYK